MSIHINYANKKTHSSFFIAINFKIWVYIEIMWIKRHMVPFLYVAINLKYGYTIEYFFMYTHFQEFIAINFKIWVYIEIIQIKRHIVPFYILSQT